MYQLLEKHYEEFVQVYADRFQDRFGFWRPVIHKSVHDYLSRPEGDGLPAGSPAHRAWIDTDEFLMAL